MKYKKSPFFNIISLTLSLLLLWQNIIYACAVSRDLLRVPVGREDTYKRIAEEYKETKKENKQDWPSQDYFRIVEKFGSAFSETLSEKEEKQLGLDFIGMHRWFGTNEDDWASTLGRMKDRKGVYLGVGYSGVNLSRLCHGDFDLAIILDINPYVTEVFMPIRAALISMSNSRAEYLSILAGVKFNDDELADLKEASLEEIYQAVLRKTNRVIEPELTTGKLKQVVWARIEKQFSREATKKSAREFWNKYSDIFFGLGRMVKTMVVPDEIKVEDSIKGRESWLANEDNFNKIKKMTQEGRILGITGSLLDPRKMNRVTSYLEERNLKVSVVYISNIPEWLNREIDMKKRKQNFQILSQNIELLPTKEAVLITHGSKSHIRDIPDKEMLLTDEIRRIFEKSGYLKDLLGGIRRLKNDKARAEVIDGKIFFNELWIYNIPEEEIERLIAHEAQYIRTDYLRDNDKVKLGGLCQDERFKKLQERIGVQFEKIIREKGPILAKPVESYQAPWEALSLLRGYEVYLAQGAHGETQPYEFIEAFKPEDLKFLDEEYLYSITKDFVPEQSDIGDLFEEDDIERLSDVMKGVPEKALLNSI